MTVSIASAAVNSSCLAGGGGEFGGRGHSTRVVRTPATLAFDAKKGACMQRHVSTTLHSVFAVFRSSFPILRPFHLSNWISRQFEMLRARAARWRCNFSTWARILKRKKRKGDEQRKQKQKMKMPWRNAFLVIFPSQWVWTARRRASAGVGGRRSIDND